MNKLKNSATSFLPQIALTFSSLFWAGNFIVGRALRDDIPAITMNYWRWIIALIMLLPLTLPALYQHRGLILKHWRFITLLAITGIAGFHIAVYLALQTTSAINALLFLSISPLVIILGSRLLHYELISQWQVMGIVLSLLGVTALITHGNPERILALQFNQGDLWMLLAVLCWSIYSVVLKQKPHGLSQKALLGSTVIIGVILMTPVFILSAHSFPGFEINAGNITGLLYISLFASVFAYFFWNYGVAQIGPNKSGVFLHLMPLFGAILSILFLDEGLKLYHWIGAILIAAGIFISSRKH